MGERLLCKQEVVGSIPSASTIAIDVVIGAVVSRVGSATPKGQEPLEGTTTRIYVGRAGAMRLPCASPLRGLERDHGQVKMKCK